MLRCLALCFYGSGAICLRSDLSTSTQRAASLVNTLEHAQLSLDTWAKAYILSESFAQALA
eukprot:3294685-Karenia_brevis.AAC.1